jgi:hypothetical protein
VDFWFESKPSGNPGLCPFLCLFVGPISRFDSQVAQLSVMPPQPVAAACLKAIK